MTLYAFGLLTAHLRLSKGARLLQALFLCQTCPNRFVRPSGVNHFGVAELPRNA
jgi:hypothetical protein